MSDSEDNKNENVLKVVLIGESGVGKTSIINQFVNGQFDPDEEVSINSSFKSKSIKIEGTGKVIKFCLWDTAGQEKYRSLSRIFYKDSKIIIFVYEITGKKTFKALQDYWYKEVKNNSKPDSILVLVGNKSDLYNFAQVEKEDAEKWADEIGAIFQLTSAKNSNGLNILFQNIGNKFLNPDFDYKSADNKIKQAYDDKKGKDNNKEDDDNVLSGFKITKINNSNEITNQNKKSCCK